MAIYSCNISNVSRAKGSSACATLSYIQGVTVRDERLGKTFYGFGRTERIEATGTILPDCAPEEWQNPAKLFNSIEQYEKADNARTAKKVMVALPREFSADLQRKVVEEFIRDTFTCTGYAAAYAIHTDPENNNPHAHILVANRQIDPQTHTWAKVKRKMEYVLDADGNRVPIIDPATGAQKVDGRNRKQWKRISVEQNPLDQKDYLQSLREIWAKECNQHLAPEEQIDHRSNAARGIEELPTIHEGYAAREMEQRGVQTDRVQVNQEIQETNQEIRETNKLLQMIQRLIELLKQRARFKALSDRFSKLGERLQQRIKQKARELPVGGIVHMDGIAYRIAEIDTASRMVALEDIGTSRRFATYRQERLADVVIAYDREPAAPVATKQLDGGQGATPHKMPLQPHKSPQTEKHETDREGYQEGKKRQAEPLVSRQEGKTPKDQEKPEFEPGQMQQIRYGFMNGLTQEQVAVYARPEFDWRQMEQIRVGLEDGLTMEEVATYAKPEFDAGQMEEIRWGLMNGLAMEQVAVYARPEYIRRQMRQVRLGLENGLSEEQVQSYAKPEYSAEQMGQMRVKLLEQMQDVQEQEAPATQGRHSVREQLRDIREQQSTQKQEPEPEELEWCR